jgi:cytochrome c
MAGPALDYTKVRTALYPEENRFTKVILEEKLDEPMELALLPGNKVLFIQRKGEVKLFDPADGKSRTIAKIPVSIKYLPDSTGKRDDAEDGLLGLTIDPDFAKNHWIYLYYSPAGDDAKNILTRYEMRGDELLLDSKKVLLDVKVQRDQCCHTGGSQRQSLPVHWRQYQSAGRWLCTYRRTART